MKTSLSHTYPLNASIDFRGFPVRFHEVGAGTPLIMLHNGGANHFIWERQIQPFSATHHVFALDLLGFGESGRPCQPLTLELFVEMLYTLVQTRKLAAPILMGNCIGAAIALEYAQQHPNRVHGLVLCNLCGGQSMMRYFHPFMFPQQGLHDDLLYRWMFAPSKWEWVRRKVIDRLYGKEPLRSSAMYQELLQGITHPIQPQSRMMLIKGLASFSKFDHYQQEEAELPAMYLCWGEQNKVLPLHRGEQLRQRLNPDEWAVYPDQGHLLMAEAPDRFNSEVETFLTQIDP
ncbi:MAG: alpha/beta hydrolase [Bacteroidota bacterium]